jgi:hypothetical protein
MRLLEIGNHPRIVREFINSRTPIHRFDVQGKSTGKHVSGTTSHKRLVRATRPEQALAPLEGETCGRCYTTLTPQTVNELHLGRPVFCKKLRLPTVPAGGIITDRNIIAVVYDEIHDNPLPSHGGRGGSMDGVMCDRHNLRL